MVEWRRCKLGDLVEVKHGYAFLGEYFADKGTHIVLTPGNFFEKGGFKKKEDKEKWYTGPVPDEYVLGADDLLVAMTEQAEGLLGSSALVPCSGLYLHNQRLGLILVRDQKQADKKFLYHLFNYQPVRDQIRGSASGTKIRHTAPSRIAEVNVEVPPLPIQRRIAGILSAYDELIENSQRRIRILESMARALYREWFVHFRFPGHENHPKVPSPLGEIPKGWLPILLGDLVATGCVSLQTGPFGTQLKAAHYASEGTPVINVRNIGFGTLKADKLEYLPPERVEEHRRHRLRAKDIVFGRKGAVERHLLVSDSEDGWIQGSDCIRLRVESGTVTALFLSLGFREEDHQRWMQNQCSGGATMASLNQDILCRIPLIIPPTVLQTSFEHVASSVLKQVSLLALLIQNLRRTRDLLLPRLLSGQVDLGES